ncbi:MAG: KTSC domain-containing protein [Acidobacteria bacterium]|nr:KTSC domain-containing protein [Acidobacteriota bacterium]
MPDMIYVDSSNLEQIGYDSDNMELHIIFKDSSLYVYLNVPVQIYEELQGAPSKGSYLNREVKGTYEYDKR